MNGGTDGRGDGGINGATDGGGDGCDGNETVALDVECDFMLSMMTAVMIRKTITTIDSKPVVRERERLSD